MITQKIQNDEEFFNPNINYEVLMSKIRNRILLLEEDISNIKDSEVKGYAEKQLLKLRKDYFDYLKVDFELQHTIRSNPEIYGVQQSGEKDEII